MAKNTYGKAFSRLVQVITCQKDMMLLPKASIEREMSGGELLQYAGDVNRNPIFIKPDFKSQGFLRNGRKQVIHHIQVVFHHHLDSKRVKNVYLVENRLYPLLTQVRNRSDINELLKECPNFSIFPRQEEFLSLLEKYGEACPDNLIRTLIVSKGGKISYSNPKETIKQSKKMLAINKDFLWEKIQQFNDFVRSFLDNTLEEHKLLWLDKELENVSPATFPYHGTAWQRSRQEDTSADPEIRLGVVKAKNKNPVIGYRVYGYFALCCLEFLYDMHARMPVFVCETCGTLQTKPIGSKRMSCAKKQNPKCRKEQQNNRQAKHRSKG